METRLTSGSITGNLMRFSLPYMLSYFLQTLYGMADLFIIGQFCTTADVTAVSVGSQIMHMLTVMIVGLAMGSTVLIGKTVGEGKSKALPRIIGNTFTLFGIIAVAATIALLLLRVSIVRVMSTPAEAVDATVRYVTVCFIGIPFITAYNIFSSVFRGLGDSKRPMYFIAIACFTNIVLDYVFIGMLGLGTAGAALGTTLSQTLSVIVSFVAFRRMDGYPAVSGSDFRPDRGIFGTILRVGIPVCLQDGFVQIAFLTLTIIANKRGLNDAAAVGIVEKMIGFMFIVPSSMLSAVSVLAAQNIGAGKPERAKKTLFSAVAAAVGFGCVMTAASLVFADQLVGLFEKNPEVIRLGGEYMRSYVFDCIFAGIHFSFSGYFCACGHSGLSFMHNSASILLARIPLAYILSGKYPATLFPMGLGAPIGSLLSSIICIVAFIILQKHEKTTV